MNSEKDILRIIKWNKEHKEQHRESVRRCSHRLYKESWNVDIRNYKFPEEVEIIDYHRCKFNGISYHVGISSYLIANKDIGKQPNGKRKYKAHKLHRDIFEYFNKVKIEKGYQIHHLDNDVSNNVIDNLVLVSSDEHKILHNKKVRA